MSHRILGVFAPFLRRPVFGLAAFLILGLVLSLWHKLALAIALALILIIIFVKLSYEHAVHPANLMMPVCILIGYLLMQQALYHPLYLTILRDHHLAVSCEVTGRISRIRVSSDYTRIYLDEVHFHSEDENFIRAVDGGSIGENIPSDGEVALDGSFIGGDLISGRMIDARSEDVLVYDYDNRTDYQVGDVIKVIGTAKAFDKATNPGQFDMRIYYDSQKIGYKVNARSMEITHKNTNPFLKLTSYVSNKLHTVYSEICENKYASVFDAIVLGERDELDQNISDLFSMCGIGHILAISGLHISMLGMGLYRFLKKLSLPPAVAIVIGGCTIILYGIMTGNGISSVRALIMFLLAAYADVIGRSYDLLTGTSVAAILMLVYSPLYLLNSGFLLSFMAVLGIAFLTPAIKTIHPTRNAILNSFYGSLGISLMTTPITLYYYFQIPLLSIFLNMLVVPLMTYVMTSGIVGAIGGLMHPILGKIGIAPGVFILRFYEWVCTGMLQLPGAVLTPGRPKTWQLILYYGLIIVGLYFAMYWTKKDKGVERTQRHYVPRRIAGAFTVLALILIMWVRWPQSEEVVFLDVGQGDGIYIHTKDDVNILIDGGSSSNRNLYDSILEPFLLSRGVTKLDYWIMTHADADHTNAAKELIRKQTVRVDQVLMPLIDNPDDAYNEIRQLATEEGARVHEMKKGDSLTCGNLCLHCLHPSVNFQAEDRNCYSTSLLLIYNGQNMLLCGDICADEERLITEELADLPWWQESKPLDILKANHHGSRYSSCEEFLDFLQPKKVVISCGYENKYGHPHEEALERMRRVGAQILRTDESGAVCFALK